MRVLYEGDRAIIRDTPRADALDYAVVEDDAFALRFSYDPGRRRHNVVYASGVTNGQEIEQGFGMGPPVRVWDFRQCAQDAIRGWQPEHSALDCGAGIGLRFTPQNADPQIVGPDLSHATPGNAGFARLRFSATYPPEAQGAGSEGRVAEWFWAGDGGGFTSERRLSITAKADGQPHVYWTYVPLSDIGTTLTRLRLDPLNAEDPFTLHWIALDWVSWE
jgi:hypothetical protein